MRSYGCILICGVFLLSTHTATGATLAERFQITRPTAQHLLIIDTSGSMRPFFDQVTEAVRGLLHTLPPEDTLTVYQFDDYPVRLAHGQIASLDLAEVLPKGVNSSPSSRTEIGECFDRMLDEVENSKTALITIFFLTDGKEEARSDSAYGKSHDAAWQKLAERGAAVCQGKEVYGFGLGLKTRTDVGLLSRILPSNRVEVVTLTRPEDLRERLQGMSEKIRRNWLRLAVQEELANHQITLVHTSAPRFRGDHVTAEVAVLSAYPHLPLGPADLTVVSEHGGFQLIPEGPYTAPVGTLSDNITLTAPIEREKAGFFTRRRTVQGQVDATIAAETALLDADEIAALGLSPELAVAPLHVSFPYEYSLGSPVSFIVLVCLTPVVLLLAGILFLRTKPPALFGRLSVRGTQTFDLSGYRKQSVRVGRGEADILVNDATGSCKIAVRRESGLDTLSIAPCTGTLIYQGRALTSSAVVDVERNRFDFTLGDIPLSIVSGTQCPAPSARWGRFLLTMAVFAIVCALVWRYGP